MPQRARGARLTPASASAPVGGVSGMVNASAPAAAQQPGSLAGAPTVGQAIAPAGALNATGAEGAAAAIGRTQEPTGGAVPIGGGAVLAGGAAHGASPGEAPATHPAPANTAGAEDGRSDAAGRDFRGSIDARITVHISGVSAMDPEAVAQLARVEIDRAQRRQLDVIRRGLYD